MSLIFSPYIPKECPLLGKCYMFKKHERDYIFYDTCMWPGYWHACIYYRICSNTRDPLKCTKSIYNSKLDLHIQELQYLGYPTSNIIQQCSKLAQNVNPEQVGSKCLDIISKTIKNTK